MRSSAEKLGPGRADFHAWLVGQAKALRERRHDAIDWQRVAEELEAMAASERRQLVSLLTNLLVHLLKWKYQPERRSGSWRASVANARRDINDVLSDSPSLKARRREFMRKAYERARAEAGGQMGYDQPQWEAVFPPACPWTFEQFMREDFWPEPGGDAGRE